MATKALLHQDKTITNPRLIRYVEAHPDVNLKVTNWPLDYRSWVRKLARRAFNEGALFVAETGEDIRILDHEAFDIFIGDTIAEELSA